MKLVRFSGCRVTIGAGGGHEAGADDDADLALGDGELVLSYWDERGAVVFVGVEEEPGRFALHARSRPRRATLEREAPDRFSGRWFEGEASGTLRVELSAGAAPPPVSRH